MHGEYKVPGGKLVVVDLSVDNDVITDFQLSGDFFLDPDSALNSINHALVGMPSSADAQSIGAAVRRALPTDAVLLGFSPEAVAVAVRRSLAHATNWHDYQWELIRAKAVPPVLHIALDELLAKRLGAGQRKPTLRIWEWDESAVVIGCFQSVRNEVDLDAAERYGFDIVRRVSGGGAMLMEKGAVITYSLYAPEALVRGMSFIDSYAFLDDWVLAALRSLGIDAVYKPLNDIVGPHGKIGGAAQRRFHGVVLHHATLAYDMDKTKLTQVLRIGREKLSDKGITSAAKRVDPLRSQTGLARQAIIDRFAATFTDRYAATPGDISAEEYVAAQKLVDTKFSTHEWLYRVP